MKPAALLLAAGQSRRMKENKLLAPLNGKPLIRHAAEALLAELDEVLVITGHEADKTKAALAGLAVRCHYHAGYGEGMGSSLAAGMAALPQNSEAVLVALGDMPFISPALINALLNLYTLAPEAAIIAPLFEGRRGHPVIFRRPLFDALQQCKGDEGAQAIIKANRKAMLLLPCEDDSCCRDIDDAQTLSLAQKGKRAR